MGIQGQRHPLRILRNDLNSSSISVFRVQKSGNTIPLYTKSVVHVFPVLIVLQMFSSRNCLIRVSGKELGSEGWNVIPCEHKIFTLGTNIHRSMKIIAKRCFEVQAQPTKMASLISTKSLVFYLSESEEICMVPVAKFRLLTVASLS